MGWWDFTQHSKPPAPQLVEPEPPTKPTLYDANGRPLVKEKEPMGFKPPKERK